MSFIITPRKALLVAYPCSTKSSTTDLISFIGIANPKFSTSIPDDFAVTIPTNSPLALNNPPPELPGFTPASV